MNHTKLSISKRIWVCHVTVSVLILIFAALACIGMARVILPGQSWQADMIALVWPESSPQEELQFALGRLRRCADTYTTEENDELQEACGILEQRGIAVAVCQDGQIVYATKDSNPWQTITSAQQTFALQQTGIDTVNPNTDTAAMIWKKNALAYMYLSRNTGVQVAAVSQENILMPQAYKGMYPLHIRQTCVWLSAVWLCISGLLLWIVLSKRMMTHMMQYIQLRCSVQTGKRHRFHQHQDSDC